MNMDKLVDGRMMMTTMMMIKMMMMTCSSGQFLKRKISTIFKGSFFNADLALRTPAKSTDLMMMMMMI